MAEIPADRVRAQLARILASRAFAHAARLRRFLEFSVEAALVDDGPALKEYVIATEVCGRPADFDPASDPIVRVDASRLRARLKAYYTQEGEGDPIEIVLPKGSYAARFVTRGVVVGPHVAASNGAADPASQRSAVNSLPASELPRTCPTVAVLPFVNLRTDPDTDFFSDGLTEELITLLSRVDGLRVVARTTVFQYKGRAVDVRDIGQQLSVTHVLEGSVREADRRLRITARLTETSTGWLLWSEKFEREVTALFTIQDEICASLVAALQMRLVEGLTAERPADVEAHRWYLRGRHHWNRRTREALEKSVTCYRTAIERDPAYALPYCGLADSLTVQALNEHADPAVVLPQAKACVARAHELAPHLPEPLVSGAFLKSVWDWQWEEAEQNFRDAIARSPSSATAHYLFAVVNLAPRGRWDEALHMMETALTLDPISAVLRRDLGLIRYLQRDFAGAEAELHAAHAIDPSFVGHFFWLGRTLAEQHRWDEAEAALRTRAAAASNLRLLSVLTHTLARAGRRAEAQGLLSTLREARHRPDADLSVAIALIGLYEYEAALEHLSRAAEQRTLTLFQIAVDPIYDPLRQFPSFQALLRRMRLPTLPPASVRPRA